MDTEVKLETNTVSLPLWAGETTVELTMVVTNPDGRAIRLEIPCLVLTQPGQLVLDFSEETDEQIIEDPQKIYARPGRKFLDFVMQDAEMRPKGIVNDLVFTQIDPEEQTDGS